MDRGAIRRWLALGMAVLTASGLLALSAPGAAHAASGQNCPGRKVRTLPFSTGAVHVYKSGGLVCAVTVAKHPGPRRWMTVSVQARGFRPAREEGLRTHRIGPVDTYAGQRCVRVRGSRGSGSVSTGWILC
ncbi:hypothetical protein [Streptomyces sp. enrichment culture]|uniref:hypothetical protein n=1 Tax=Streptomyces sp. enrichment culture TaxID=1795815 RepID=UPI003F558FC5